ncbi:MAG: Transcriptional regulator DegU, LuxR family [Brockia lithotrophica]|uniref:Transcriptional regulator DegU, LuxR family n=1 Tax=Brockia lithotrophica TaxID=933949 RepID=A0A2T5GAU2_9BACL|nr:response regulator transcription factor [Brockia lithotrophica]PTQ53303.1 MAG: Transcriptional regulator DegU, LuxR family [Brockia lithotrophica]
MSERITILLADDHALFREGLRHILGQEEGFTIVGEARSGHEAVDKAALLTPDVVLMDINMPEMNGIEATRKIRALGLPTRVIVLSIHDDEEYVRRALLAGADGYLLKEIDAQTLVSAVRAVHAGGAYLHPRLAGYVIAELRRLSVQERPPRASGSPPERSSVLGERWQRLTARERDILLLIAEGLSNGEIGKRLGISEKTVKNHLASIRIKLNISERTKLAIEALHYVRRVGGTDAAGEV